MNAKKIIEAAKAAGADAKVITMGAGGYFDGTPHGITFEAVQITIDRWTNNNSTATENAVEKALKRFRGIYTARSWSHVFTVWNICTQEDHKRAEEAQRESRIFLDAFWEEIHRQKEAGEKDNADKAITAGRAALDAAGYGREAA